MLVVKLIFLIICIVMMCICLYNGMFTEKNEVWRRLNVLGASMMGVVIGIFIVLISIGGLL